MPAKPVETLSRTPSRTEVLTTSAKTPSMRSVSVRIERSLCAHSSTSQPAMNSWKRLNLAPQDRRRPSTGLVPPAATGKETLLITQRLHRGKPAGLPRRVEREQEAEGGREGEGPQEAGRLHVELDMEKRRNDLREADPRRESREGPEARDQERLGHELLEHFAARGADRHLHAHFAHAFLERRHLDVHVHHAAADEGQDARQHEDHVVDVALALPLAHPRGDVVDAEVLLLAVVSPQDRGEPFAEGLHGAEVPNAERDPVDALPPVPLHAARDERRRNGHDPVPPRELVPLPVAPPEHLFGKRADHRDGDVS